MKTTKQHRRLRTYWKVLLLLPALCIAMHSRAQYTFSGKITYERKVNVHKLWEGNEWLQQFKDKIPKFLVNYFELSFTPANGYYKPGKEVEMPKLNWGLPPGAENEVFTDFNTGMVTANKLIYEQRFLIQDSMRKLKWRITNEVRTIADYKCRKAVTKICDSVYVVAFYTDDIAVSGGPEQFGGLPGMILELAIPRLASTWVATSVNVATVKNPEQPSFPKGKKVNFKELEGTLRASFKDWGKEAQRNIWWGCL